MTTEPNNQANEPLDTQGLTWAVLLSRWTEFARSAVALPEQGEQGLVRRSVTDIITLQAVWFALSHLEELDEQERGLGLDRAGVLIDRHVAAIRLRFEGEMLPQGLQDLLDDVQERYAQLKRL